MPAEGGYEHGIGKGSMTRELEARGPLDRDGYLMRVMGMFVGILSRTDIQQPARPHENCRLLDHAANVIGSARDGLQAQDAAAPRARGFRAQLQRRPSGS